VGLRARAAAGPLGQAPLVAAATAAVCLADAFTGRIGEAEAHRAEAASIVDALPTPSSPSGSTPSPTSSPQRSTWTVTTTRPHMPRAASKSAGQPGKATSCPS
jgi:hypothetical protein